MKKKLDKYSETLFHLINFRCEQYRDSKSMIGIDYDSFMIVSCIGAHYLKNNTEDGSTWDSVWESTRSKRIDKHFNSKKLTIFAVSNIMNLPKETVRRKVLELEKLGVLKRTKKQIIIDRSVFPSVKPERQIALTSKYVHLVSRIFNKDKIFYKNTDSKYIESVIKKNFSLCWRWFYRMQIPMIIGYHDLFEDLATFHLWGTVAMNQAFNYKKDLNTLNVSSLTPDYMEFNKGVIEGTGGSMGISAMSISEMTNIPRATVIRKCKYLVKNSFLQLNDKKQYTLTGYNSSRVLPYQKKIFKNKAKFLRKTLNLLTIS